MSRPYWSWRWSAASLSQSVSAWEASRLLPDSRLTQSAETFSLSPMLKQAWVLILGGEIASPLGFSSWESWGWPLEYSQNFNAFGRTFCWILRALRRKFLFKTYSFRHRDRVIHDKHLSPKLKESHGDVHIWEVWIRWFCAAAADKSDNKIFIITAGKKWVTGAAGADIQSRVSTLNHSQLKLYSFRLKAW